MRSMNRREIFPAIAATGLAAVAAVSFAQPETLSAKGVHSMDTHSDARLIALCDAYHAAYTAAARLIRANSDRFGAHVPDEAFDAQVRATDEFDAIAVEVVQTPANTLLGAAAKAAVAWKATGLLSEPIPADDEALAWSVFRDVARLAGDQVTFS